jgi:cysteine desulfurase NifS/selenium donor protein
MDQIYLDYNATTPIDPEVAAEMRPYLEEYFGNPSSMHSFGIKSREAVERARSRVALLLNCHPQEIIFTSGGTESNNMALKGAAYAMRSKGNHIIISAVEHPAVTEVVNYLGTKGFEISIAPVDESGMVDPEDIRNLLRPGTVLVSVMHANNEVGSIQPVKAIAAIVHQHGALLHTDAAQSAGKIPVDVQDLGVDLLSLAGHKLYAPKGIGALYIRKGVKIEKLIHGADHEQNLRAGTENVLEIAGLGKACELAFKRQEAYRVHTSALKKKFIEGLSAGLINFRLNGHPELALPNTVSVGFSNLNAQTILSAMPQLAASAGAACHTGDAGDSSVLGAMKVSPEYARGTIRFSLGYTTTVEEVDEALRIIVQTIRSLTPDASLTSPESGRAEAVKLTRFTHGLGCACKIRPADLEKVLAGLPPVTDPNVLVGAEKRDDAAVYKINDDLAIVQTVDFFTPVVDDPYTFGAIAAANSLSDVYAMGGQASFALNIAAFPVNRLPLDVLNEIVRGASDKAAEAGISILGGHSIEDNEPKFGMVVTGFVNPRSIVSNAGARPGDALVLTKPVGTGIISTATKMGLAKEETIREAEKVMMTLNKVSSELMLRRKVNACTDITGFGLVGHLHEMAAASGVDASIEYQRIPFISEVLSLALAGAIPGGTKANYNFALQWTDFGQLTRIEKYLVCDAQSSGGLLVSLPAHEAEIYIAALHENDIRSSVIGYITGKGTGLISVV